MLPLKTGIKIVTLTLKCYKCNLFSLLKGDFEVVLTYIKEQFCDSYPQYESYILLHE